MGGDVAGTPDPYLPKKYSVPHESVLSNNNWEKEGRREDLWCLSSQVTYM